MRKISALAVVLLVGTAARGADLAAVFAARPSAFRAALSPDGSKIVYLSAYKTGGRAVIVADTASGKTAVVLATPDLAITPYSCTFKTETRLICMLSGIVGSGKEMVGFTRVVAVDTDGKNVKLLGQHNTVRTQSMDAGGAGIIDWLPDDPHHVLMQVRVTETNTGDTNIHYGEAGAAGAIVDVETGVRRIIERSDPIVSSLDADGHGNIRYRSTIQYDPSGYARDKVSFYARPSGGSKNWKLLGNAVLSDNSRSFFDGFDEDGTHLYQIKLLDGRQALYRVPADGSGTSELVYSHPSVDISGVWRIGKYRRAVAATYTADRDELHFFDPKLSELSRSLGRALTDKSSVSVVDESWDGTKKLIYADSDNTPGHYYLYDGGTRKLTQLVSVYPQYDDVALGQVRAVSYPARDGTPIPAYLTLPPGKTSARGLPAIVMPHGGPSSRDSIGFDWLPQFFAAKGYAVLQANYRGSAGYGQAWFEKNGFQSWATAMNDVNDGAHWLTAQGADPKRLAIVGWSYGGYAALQANVVEPNLYKAVVAIAPVTDLSLLRTEALVYSNFKMVDAMIGSGPHIVAGSPDRNAAKIMAPVLMFHADKDQNVDIEQSRAMASALRSAGKRVQLIEYAGLNHQIDDSEARRDMLAKSAAFLAAELK